MEIPMQGVDISETPWTFEMAQAEQGQLANKVAGLLADVGVGVAVLFVNLAQRSVDVSVIVNDAQQPPVSIPAWRQGTLSAFPANYVATRLRGVLGL
jgi:hypothetical protein